MPTLFEILRDNPVSLDEPCEEGQVYDIELKCINGAIKPVAVVASAVPLPLVPGAIPCKGKDTQAKTALLAELVNNRWEAKDVIEMARTLFPR